LAALHDIVQKWIFTFEDMASLDAQFDEAKLATGTVRDVKDFAKTEWAQSWGATRTVPDREGGEITIPAPPWHFSRHDAPLDPQTPALQGEHNSQILSEIGYSDEDIEQLYKLSALVGGQHPASS
jgi:crotonobetainyl-CoA:carnitine CoA-transferase CaiB-like acyl-CoA transferase